MGGQVRRWAVRGGRGQHAAIRALLVTGREMEPGLSETSHPRFVARQVEGGEWDMSQKSWMFRTLNGKCW